VEQLKLSADLREALRTSRLASRYVVRSGWNLQYGFRVNPKTGSIDKPQEHESRAGGGRVKRKGDYEVDLVILREPDHLDKGRGEQLPIVVLELKQSASTHDVLTYASKATDHRRVYPWLRYGLVTYNEWLAKRYLWHGRGFDFILCIQGLRTRERRRLLRRVISREIIVAEEAIRVLTGEHIREYPSFR